MVRKRKFHTSHKHSKKQPTLIGKLCCSARGGFGIVPCGNSDGLYIAQEDMYGANNGDTVAVRPTGKRGGKRNTARVINIIERSFPTLTAVVLDSFDGGIMAAADDKRFYPEIFIPKNHSCGALLGERIVVEIVDVDRYGNPDGAVIKVLGNADGLYSRIEGIIYNHNIKTDFDAETIAAADKIKDKISENELAGRLNLRDETIFTIDGDDAKDFDDAVSIRKIPNGYKLGVHIADVSHYVKSGSPIDREAFLRGTSVYLADRVIPMLPEALSNGVCSLVPNRDRLTLSCIMTVNMQGEVTKYTIAKSVICSKHRMTYKNVEKILNKDRELCREYKDILTSVRNMNTLADILTEKRHNRGSIDFDITEASIDFDKQNYRVNDISPCDRLKSQRIIEEFMLLANETVAKHAIDNSLPLVYRIHDAPDSDKLIGLSNLLNGFNLTLPINPNNAVPPKVFSQLVEKIKGEDYEQAVSMGMLRAMMKAEYSTECKGHFGLATEYYCHFTSPIRRYPDLMVHRILSSKPTATLKKACALAAPQSSETEQRAQECERDVVSLLKTAYIARFIGRDFTAHISGFSEYGMYAELASTVEGMIRFETLKDDYYFFDEKTYTVKSKHKNRTFRLGDKIYVTVERADLDSQRIDFLLREE